MMTLGRLILQRRALGEGKLHDILIGFAGADDADWPWLAPAVFMFSSRKFQISTPKV
jgi:hypothetical protein